MTIPFELNMTHCGDCLEALKLLPDKCVDLVLTDPPYNVGKDYGVASDSLPDALFLRQTSSVFSECERIGRRLCIYTPHKWFREWWNMLPDAHPVIITANPAGPIRSGWSCQYVVMLTVGFPNIGERDVWENIPNRGHGYFFKEDTLGHDGYTSLAVLLKCVEAMTVTGQLILDPYMGTGGSGVAAIQTGRQFLGFEINPEYTKLANDRCEAARKGLTLNEHRSGQQSLFGDEAW